MASSGLEDAFAHHVWATLRIIDTCFRVRWEQLSASVPGTYGSILETLRHIAAADAGYLFAMTGGRVARIDADDWGSRSFVPSCSVTARNGRSSSPTRRVSTSK